MPSNKFSVHGYTWSGDGTVVVWATTMRLAKIAARALLQSDDTGSVVIARYPSEDVAVNMRRCHRCRRRLAKEGLQWCRSCAVAV